jgi:hypothetical protein
MKRTTLIHALAAAAVAALLAVSPAFAEGTPSLKPHGSTAKQLKALRTQVRRLINLVSEQDGRLAGAEGTLADLTTHGVLPTGSAGGVLAGTYPSPTLAPNSLDRSVFQAGAVGPQQLSGNLSALHSTGTFVDSGTTEETTVTCPEGSRLLSGGPEWSSRTNGTAIISSSPSFTGDPNRTWDVQGRVDSGAPGNRLSADALCLGP